MNKFITVILSLLLFSLVGCVQIKDKKDDTEKSPATPLPGQEYAQKEAQDNIKAEITQTALKVWKNSIGTIWAHAAIEIKNTGRQSISIDNVVLSFIGKDNSILDTLNSEYAMPQVVAPGELTYIIESTKFDNINEPEEVTDIEVDFEYSHTNKLVQVFETQDIKLANEKYGDVKVTGRVKNTGQKATDDIVVNIVLLGEKDKLLGVKRGYVDITLKPGNTIGFSATRPNIDIRAEQVKKIIAKAFDDQ